MSDQITDSEYLGDWPPIVRELLIALLELPGTADEKKAGMAAAAEYLRISFELADELSGECVHVPGGMWRAGKSREAEVAWDS